MSAESVVYYPVFKIGLAPGPDSSTPPAGWLSIGTEALLDKPYERSRPAMPRMRVPLKDVWTEPHLRHQGELSRESPLFFSARIGEIPVTGEVYQSGSRVGFVATTQLLELDPKVALPIERKTARETGHTSLLEIMPPPFVTNEQLNAQAGLTLPA